MNNKAILFSLLISLSMTSVFGQRSCDVCRSLSDYRMNKWQATEQIMVEKVVDKKFGKWGVNDFKISADNKVLRKFLKKEAWGVMSNDSLFLNCRRLNAGPIYAFAEEINGELLFLAGISDEERNRQMSLVIGMGSPFGGAIASASLSVERFWYILNVESAKLELLSKERMFELLNDYPDLAEKYSKEPNPQGMITLKRYIRELRGKVYSSNMGE